MKKGLINLPPKIGKPAERALAAKGISSLNDLTCYTEKEILAWHGVGPKALNLLKAALADNKLAFVG